MKCTIRDLNNYFFKDMEHIGEVIIDYKGLDDAIINQLTIYPKDLRLTFRLGSKYDIEDLINLTKLDREIVFLIDANTIYNIDELREKGIKFYFSFSQYIATTVEDIRCLAALGVTDVFVSGMLGFNLIDARNVANETGVKLRIVPNLAQHSTFSAFKIINSNNNLTAFWVRPNDLDLYAEFIDYVEFSGLDTKQNVFYDIYFLAKDWYGKLSEIIAGLTNDVDNRGLPGAFGAFRLNCKKVCSIEPRCHHCIRCKHISDLKMGREVIEEV